MNKVIRVSRKEMEMKIRAARLYLASHKTVYSVGLLIDREGHFHLLELDEHSSWQELKRRRAAMEMWDVGIFHRQEYADLDPSMKSIENSVAALSLLFFRSCETIFELEDER